ncbi:MAG: hypothetical protein WBB36_00460, partial [Chitinophagales bacterium]
IQIFGSTQKCYKYNYQPSQNCYFMLNLFSMEPLDSICHIPLRFCPQDLSDNKFGMTLLF